MGTTLNLHLNPVIAGAALLPVAFLLTGCPNPNTYGTPRTVAPGKVSHSIAAEIAGWNLESRTPVYDEFGNPTGEFERSTSSASVPVLPTYSLRLGMAEEVDLGFRLANMSALGLDVKYNFLRSETLDLAIDPGAQWLSVGFNVFHMHLPLLVGINLSEQITLVATPGIMYGVSSYATADGSLDSDIRRLLSADGLYARAGLGINIRFTRKFAMHPEVTFLRSMQDTERDSGVSSALSYMFGIGFNFGHLPSYGAQEQ